MPLRLPRLVLANTRVIIAALITGALLHILVTLAAARGGSRVAVDRLGERAAALNTMQVMPAVTAQSQVLPFQSADIRYAICRFDAHDGPITVRASLPGPGWTFALFAANGDNFYTVSGQSGRRIDLSLLLLPSGDEFVPVPRDSLGTQGRLSIQLPGYTGLMVLQAASQGLAYRAETEAELQRAQCIPTKPRELRPIDPAAPGTGGRAAR
jgi:uncharacterized membrane protein